MIKEINKRVIFIKKSQEIMKQDLLKMKKNLGRQKAIKKVDNQLQCPKYL